MQFRSFLKTLFPSRTSGRKGRRARLAVEPLENRIVLSSTTWTSVGPSNIVGISDGGIVSGRVTAIATDPNPNDTTGSSAYVGTAGGGVWVGTNIHTTTPNWTPLTDNLAVQLNDPLVTLSVGALATAWNSTTQSTVIYAGLGEANAESNLMSPGAAASQFYGTGIIKSTDGGQTWSRPGTSNLFYRSAISKIIIDPSNQNTVYAAVATAKNGVTGNEGIWKTTNGGLSWVNTTANAIPGSSQDMFSDLVMDPSNSSVLYAAVGEPAGSAANGIYLTTDGGGTWTPMTGTGFLSGATVGRITLAISPNTAIPDVLYAAYMTTKTSPNTTIGTLYQLGYANISGSSPSASVALNVVNHFNQPTTSSLYDYVGTQGYYGTSLAVAPDDAYTLYAGGQDSFLSITGANSATPTVVDLATSLYPSQAGTRIHVDHHGIAIDPNPTGAGGAQYTVLDGNDGGVYEYYPNLPPAAIAPAPGGATESSHTVTITTTTAHGFSVGNSVTIQGVGVAGYDGTYTITGATSTTFTYTDPTSSLSNSGGGTVTNGHWIDLDTNLQITQLYGIAANPSNSSQIYGGAQDNGNFWTHGPSSIAASPGGATESANTVTITTSTAHGLSVGDTVTIQGVGVAGYNGTFVITGTTATTFTYTNPVASLGNSGGGTVTSRSWNSVTAGDGSEVFIDPRSTPNPIVYVTQTATLYTSKGSAPFSSPSFNTPSGGTPGRPNGIPGNFPAPAYAMQVVGGNDYLWYGGEDVNGSTHTGNVALWFSPDGAQTWYEIGNPRQAGSGWPATQKTFDNGFQVDDSAVDSIGVSATNPNVVYVGLRGGQILVTNNGTNISGATWTALNPPVSITSTTATAAQTLSAGTINGTINVVSTAGFPPAGTLFIQNSVGSTDTSLVTYTGITATSFTGVSTNSSVTLANGTVVTFQNDLRYSQILVDPTNAQGQVAYVTAANFGDVTGGGHVWMTTNGGNSWANISGNLPNVPAWSIQEQSTGSVGAPPVLYVGTDTGVFVSTNGGVSWSSFASGLPNVQVRTMDLNLNASNPALVVGTFGRGAWLAAIPPSVNASTANLPANAATLTIYGTGFDPVAANNAVALSSGSGIVTRSTSTSLSVTFASPPSVGTLSALVISDGVSSGTLTSVANVLPVVTASTNGILTSSVTMLIAGQGFDPVANHNLVVLSSGSGIVTGATTNQLVISLTSAPSLGALSALVLVDGVGSAGFVQVAIVATKVVLPFTDTFANDPSGALSTSWITQAGSIAVQSGNAVNTSGGASIAVLNSNPGADVSVSVDVSMLPVGGFAALVARYQGAGATNMYQAGVRNNGASGYTAEIYKNINGTWTALSVVPLAGFTGTGSVNFTVIGNLLQLFVNGSLATSTNDGTFATGVAGIRLLQAVQLASFSASVPTPVGLPFTDTFSSDAAGPLSSSWVLQAGTIAIQSGAAVNTTAGASIAVLNSDLDTDMSVTANVASIPVSGFAALVARYLGTGGNNMYQAGVRNNGVTGYTAEIYKNVNGTWTALSVVPLAGFTGSGTVTFTVLGSSLRLYVNSTLATWTSDSTFATGVAGIRLVQGVKLTAFHASVPSVVTLPFTDNFSGPNGPLSPSWFTQAGNIAIQSNQAVGLDAGVNLAVLNTDLLTAVTLTATISALPVGDFAGLVARYQGSGDANFYQAGVRNNGSGYTAEIWKNVNGTWTQLASTALPSFTGMGTLQFVASGSSLQLSVNSSPVASAMDSTFASGVVGMRLLQGAQLSAFGAS